LPLRVQRLRVEGRSVRFRALAPEAEPNGGLNFLTATLPRAPLPHQSLPLQLDVRVGETAWMLGGAVRLLMRVFPLGTWRTSVWENDAERQAWRERGFDTFVFLRKRGTHRDRAARLHRNLPARGHLRAALLRLPAPCRAVHRAQPPKRAHHRLHDQRRARLV
jgi:hypothetical protein